MNSTTNGPSISATDARPSAATAESSARRIGIYGGTFDPVHLGHLLVAQAALEELALEQLSFVPAAQSPFKPDQLAAPARLRLRLLRVALAGCPCFEVDPQEIERGGTSYSIETARGYAQRFPGAQLFWLIGADHVPSLPKWREAEALAALVEFVVLPRPGAASATPPPGFRIRQLKGFPLAVSSSEVRARARAGLPLHPLVPAAVAEILASENPYRTLGAPSGSSRRGKEAEASREGTHPSAATV